MAQIDACIYARKIKRVFESRLKDLRDKYDLKMIDVEILMYFSENTGKTASDLHRELDLNKGQVSRAIDGLRKLNMLVEFENPEDRRYLRYELADTGKSVVSEVQSEICAIYGRMMEGIDKGMQQTFFEIGKMICENIDKIND